MAAGITYVPPLLLEAGVEERYMTMVLGKGLVKLEGRHERGHLPLCGSVGGSGIMLLFFFDDGFSA